MISFRGLMEHWLIIIPNPNPFLQFWKQISIQINKRQSEKAACNVEINFQNKKGPQNGIEDTVTKIKFKNFSISKFEKILDLEIRQLFQFIRFLSKGPFKSTRSIGIELEGHSK